MEEGEDKTISINYTLNGSKNDVRWVRNVPIFMGITKIFFYSIAIFISWYFSSPYIHMESERFYGLWQEWGEDGMRKSYKSFFASITIERIKLLF